MFSALSLLVIVFCFLFFFEALVLATSLSFGNLVSRIAVVHILIR